MRRSKLRATIATLAVAVAAVVAIGPMTSSASAMTGLVGQTIGTKPVTTSVTSVAVSAFPTGGKGSGTDAVCGGWDQQLQADQADIDYAERVSSVWQYKEAVADLEEDKDAALDAGCAVID